MNYDTVHRVQDAIKEILIEWGSGDGMGSWEISKFIDAMAVAIAERLEIKHHVEGEGVTHWVHQSIGVKSPERV